MSLFLRTIIAFSVLFSTPHVLCAATETQDGRHITAYWQSPLGGLVGVPAETVTALKDDGTVLEWGRDSYDAVPRTLGRIADAKSISAGAWGVAVVKSDGTVVIRSNDPSEDFEVVAGLVDVVDVRVGLHYAFALKADGTVWGWGFYTGNSGCAFGKRSELVEDLGAAGCVFPQGVMLPPAPVPGATNVAQIDAAGATVFYRKNDGTVWIIGDDYGSDGRYQPCQRSELMQLNGLTDIVSISSATSNSLAALKSDGTVWMWGGGDWRPTGAYCQNTRMAVQISGLTRIVKIANGRNLLALRDDGSMFQFGCYGSGCPVSVSDTSPNGVSTGTDDVVSVEHVTALGSLDAVAVAEMYSLGGGGKIIVKSDRTVWAWGSGAGASMGTCNFATAYSGGDSLETARAIQDDDCLAPLNLGTGAPSPLPESIAPALAVTHLYLAIVDTRGRVWITNEAGTGTPLRLRDPSGFGYLNLVDGGDAKPDILFANISGSNASTPYLVVLTQSGKVYQCEAGVSTNICIRMKKVLDGAGSIGGGGTYVAAVKQDGTLWAWGKGPGREVTPVTQALGYTHSGMPITKSYFGTPQQIPEIDAVAAVAKSQGNALALKQDGTVFYWGGDAASTRKIQVDGAVAVAGGAGANYVLRSDGSVLAWGRNSFGELGTGQSSYTPAESWVTMSPVRVDGLDSVVAIAAGDTSASVIRGDGSLWSFGANYGGVLGIGANGGASSLFAPVRGQLDALATIAGGPNSMAAITQDGKVWVWGKNIVTPTSVKGDDGGQMDAATAALTVPKLASSGTQTVLSADSIECLFRWAEVAYAQYLHPAGDSTRTEIPYTYRYYAGSQAYLGVSAIDSHLYYLGSSSDGTLFDLGTVSTWLGLSDCQ